MDKKQQLAVAKAHLKELEKRIRKAENLTDPNGWRNQLEEMKKAANREIRGLEEAIQLEKEAKYPQPPQQKQGA